MELFLALLEYSDIIGIRPLRPNQTSVFNRRNLSVFLFFVLFFISSTACLYFDDSTFEEYSQTFYAWLTMLLTGIGFTINVLLTVNLFQLLDKLKHSIEKCKPFSLILFKNENFKLEMKVKIGFCMFH